MKFVSRESLRQFILLTAIYAVMQVGYYRFAADDIHWVGLVISSLFYGVLMTAVLARGKSKKLKKLNKN